MIPYISTRLRRRMSQCNFSSLLPVKEVLSKKIGFHNWINEILPTLQPPVSNKLLYKDGHMKVMVVGGPNERDDYHIQNGEEFFLQLKGDMCLKVMERGVMKDVVIPEGHMFLLPPNIPHSPQRPAGTLGIVIERHRPISDRDGLQWFVPGTSNLLYHEYFHCKDLGVQIREAIGRFRQTPQYSTKSPIPGESKKIQECKTNTTARMGQTLDWIRQMKITGPGELGCIYKGEFQVSFMKGPLHNVRCPIPMTIGSDLFIWSYSGTSSCVLTIDNEKHEIFALNNDETMIVPSRLAEGRVTSLTTGKLSSDAMLIVISNRKFDTKKKKHAAATSTSSKVEEKKKDLKDK